MAKKTLIDRMPSQEILAEGRQIVADLMQYLADNKLFLFRCQTLRIHRSLILFAAAHFYYPLFAGYAYTVIISSMIIRIYYLI